MKIKKLFGLVALILVICLFSYLSGYRFTSLDAASSHFEIDNSAKIISEVNLDWSRVYLFNTQKGPRTVMAIREGLLWRAPAATTFDISKDLIKTIGWISYYDSEKGKSLLLLAIENNDPNVKYIEVGPTNERLRKVCSLGEPLIFYWDRVIEFNKLNPVALSKDRKLLYEYRYPNNTTSINTKDLKWYPIDGDR